MTLNNPFDFQGKHFLVTGAASGIGKATALLLAAQGARLALVDYNEEGLKQTQQLCNRDQDVQVLTINLKDAEAIKTSVLAYCEQHGKLDGFVHIAGMPYVAPLKVLNTQKYYDVFAVNTAAAMELAKVFINRKVAADRASIIFISSVYGNVGSAANVAYAMSKSALHGITRSLAIELAPKNIRVNCIAPGFIKTEMLTDISGNFDQDYDDTLARLHPLGLGEATDVANTIAFLFSDSSKWITGSVINVDGGFTAQ